MPDGSTITNSTCLIGLDRAGLLRILEPLYAKILVPPAVAREWGSGVPAWIEVRTVQNQALSQSLRLNLGAGEAEAIALAVELSPARIVLDDKKARRIARQFKLPVMGTLAILLLAKERGLIPSLRDALQALAAAQFRISEDLQQAILRRAGE